MSDKQLWNSISQDVNITLWAVSSFSVCKLQHVYYLSVTPVSIHQRLSSQILKCIRQISHNTPYCKRNVRTCTFLLQNGALRDMGLVHCGLYGICATSLEPPLWGIVDHQSGLGHHLTQLWFVADHRGMSWPTLIKKNLLKIESCHGAIILVTGDEKLASSHPAAFSDPRYIIKFAIHMISFYTTFLSIDEYF